MGAVIIILQSMKVLIIFMLALEFSNAEYYCGQPLKDRRIVGGVPALPYQFPWQVVLYYYSGDSLLCGGSIISTKTILTAAHCVDYGVQWVGIPDGGTDIIGIPRMKVEKIIAHPNYDGGSISYDFALLILEHELEWGEGVLPICLPNPQNAHEFDDVLATITGWGDDRPRITENLQRANVTTMTNNACKEAYGDDIDGTMICAAAPGIDACQGDSGGPMTTLRQDQAYYVQIGIVSWGYGCARDEFPGVYSRVTDQLYWILLKAEGRYLPPPVEREARI